jgi:Uncharacterized protein conserved in bacteria (DUF2188)
MVQAQFSIDEIVNYYFQRYILYVTLCGMSVRYSVIAWLNGTWRVKRSGAKRATSVHSTRSEAIDKARKLAKKDLTGGTVVVHGVDGTVKRWIDYGKKSLPST